MSKNEEFGKNLSAEDRADFSGFYEDKKITKNSKYKDWIAYWARTFRIVNVTKVTAQKYFAFFNNISDHRLGNLKISELRRGDIQEYINFYGQNHAKLTVLTRMQFLRTSLKDAMAEGIISFNPATNLQPVYKEQRLTVQEQKEKREEKKWLEPREYQKLKQYLVIEIQKMLGKDPITIKKYEYPNQCIYMAILVALKTGLRFGEILGLTRDDILAETGILNVDKTWGYRSGVKEDFEPTKNFASIRKIVIDSELIIMIKIYENWLDEYGIKTKKNTLFILEGKRTFNSTFNNRLKEILERLEIQPISMHKLRHTQASYLIAKKVPIAVVAKRLGHTDTNMIRKVYGHLLKETEIQGNEMILNLI